MSPTTWYPGANNVLLIFNWGSVQPYNCILDTIIVLNLDSDVLASGVTISNISPVVGTQATFTATVAAGTPAGVDIVQVYLGAGYALTWYVTISPTPPPPPPCSASAARRPGVAAAPECAPPPPPPPVCPTPAISSVTPDIWFAGRSYSVTIGGSGFTNTADCPAPPVYITDANGNAVPFSSADVKSSKKIVVTGVAPPAADPTETACVTLSPIYVVLGSVPARPRAFAADAAAAAAPAPGAPGSACTLGNATGITVQILGNEIHCDPSLNCTQPVISTTDGSAPPVQSVVAGQPIILTTNPNLPATIKPYETTWTVPTTPANIGSVQFGPPATNGSPTTASVSPTAFKNPGLNTYWLYPNPKVSVSYQYCVNIPGVTGKNLQCSLSARATFNVTGPKATVTPVLTSPDATNEWEVTDPNAACPTQFLTFGVYPDEAPCPGSSPAIPGIAFQANVTDADGGSFSWIQIVNLAVITSTAQGHRYLPSILGPGLDNTYLYKGVSPSGLEAFDGPLVGLQNIYATKSDAFSANMYLMWQSNADSSYIKVPVGYVNWSIHGKAKNVRGTPPWILTPCGVVAPCPGASATAWASSDPAGPAPGLPTWTTILTNTAGATNLAVPTDGEEEQ